MEGNAMSVEEISRQKSLLQALKEKDATLNGKKKKKKKKKQKKNKNHQDLIHQEEGMLV